MIEINETLFGVLAVCAIRYCQGRQTYMPDFVRNAIRPHLQELTDKDIGVMIHDCEYQRICGLYGDKRIDKPGWLEMRLLREDEKTAERQMKEEKAINQLLSLIDDRKSFITKDGDNEIYRDDIEALKIGVDAIKERMRLRLILVSSVAETSYVTEHCPHCDNEATVAWLPSEDGHSLFCPYCGERIMLCSECPVRNCEAECDWDSSANGTEEPVCFWDNHFRPKQQSFEYKGYTLVQELRENFHYSIFEGNDENARFCMHAACTKKIESQEEAQEHIESYLILKKKVEERYRGEHSEATKRR